MVITACLFKICFDFLVTPFPLLRQLVCMVGLVAFLSTQSEVAYIEDLPQVVGTNIGVSDILTSLYKLILNA